MGLKLVLLHFGNSENRFSKFLFAARIGQIASPLLMIMVMMFHDSVRIIDRKTTKRLIPWKRMR
jgi:hypothetical protein